MSKSFKFILRAKLYNKLDVDAADSFLDADLQGKNTSLILAEKQKSVRFSL